MSRNRIEERRDGARTIRNNAAEMDYSRPHPPDVVNGDETELPNMPGTSDPPAIPLNFIGNYGKGLPHNDANGEVDPGAYGSFLQAHLSGEPGDFDRIRLGTPVGPSRRKLTNPQSGLAFDLEGPDTQQETMPPPPKFTSVVII